MKKTEDRKVLYLHGRPAPHKLHGRFAKSVGSEFEFVDFKLRWQDKNRSRLYIILSWIVCAFAYPRKKYDYFLIDNLHMAPILMKKLGLIKKRQKLIVHMGSHTLYFMYSNWFTGLNAYLQRFMLKNYDAVICEGKMAEELVTKILKEEAPKTYYTFLGPPAERAQTLLKIEPDLYGNNILLISNGPVGFRKYYKGLDLMIKAFNRVAKSNNSLKFFIIGDWDKEVVEECTKLMDDDNKERLIFTGRVNDIEKYIESSSLYLHCSRGDAFPTSSIEAMTAGLVPIVSEWTGTKQIVEKIDKRLVVKLDESEIAERILWYFDLDHETKASLSEKSRIEAAHFTEEKSTLHYQKVFEEIINNFEN